MAARLFPGRAPAVAARAAAGEEHWVKELERRAQAEALEKLKVPMLDKEAECLLYERGNSFNGRQARKSRDS